MRLAVITVSDRASRGEYEDLSGSEIEKVLRETFPEADIVRDLVPDEKDAILAALGRHAGADWILTTGGTGISPRDVTPEATAAFCDRELPGIAEALRAASLAETPQAMLSRGYAGLRGRTVVVNIPGSVRACRLSVRVLAPVIDHAIRMMLGEGH